MFLAWWMVTVSGTPVLALCLWRRVLAPQCKCRGHSAHQSAAYLFLAPSTFKMWSWCFQATYLKKMNQSCCVPKVRKMKKPVLPACGHHALSCFSVPGGLSWCSWELCQVHAILFTSCRRTSRRRAPEMMLLFGGRVKIWAQVSLVL